MALLKISYQRFVQSGPLLKLLILLFCGAWTHVWFFPKIPKHSFSFLESLAGILFFAGFLLGSVMFFLWLEFRGGESLEFKGDATPEQKTLFTKLLVRGGLIFCIIFFIIRRFI